MGNGRSCDVGVARGIKRYVPARVAAAKVKRATTAQVGGVEQCRTGSVQLADKGVVLGAAESGLEGAISDGEITGIGGSCDVGVARGVGHYASARVITTSAQVSGVDQ